MKGVQFAVWGLFWLFCVVLIFYGTSIGLKMIGGSKAYELPVKIHIYSMDNALDAAKVYMNTGLRYSVYQACYDNLARAGWPDLADVPVDERVVIGDKSYGQIRSSTDFRIGLIETIQQNVNTYSSLGYSFFDMYEVELPSYDSTEMVEFMPSYMTVRATSGGFLQVCKPSDCKFESDEEAENDDNGGRDGKSDEDMGTIVDTEKKPNIIEKVVLRKSSELQETIDTPCYGLYGQGVTESVRLTGIIEQELKAEIDGLLDGVTAHTSQCNEMVSKAQTRIQDKLKAESIDVVEVVLNVMYSGYDSQNLLCLFDEKGLSTAVVKVTLNGPEDKKFPVWNGQELAFEPLKLEFVVKGSYESIPSGALTI